MAGVADQVAWRIRQLREAKGWSQETLVEASGLSRDAVSRIERGNRAPRLDTLDSIATALGLTLPNLLDFSRAARRLKRSEDTRASLIDQSLDQLEPWLGDALAGAVRAIASASIKARRKVSSGR